MSSEKLTPRELEVAHGLIELGSCKAVARALEVAEKTVAAAIARIKRKTGTNSLVQMCVAVDRMERGT